MEASSPEEQWVWDVFDEAWEQTRRIREQELEAEKVTADLLNFVLD